MEASAVHAPAGLGRLSVGGPLLRLRSDEQLVALFRAGSEEAFAAIHDRYRQRLFAYVRQMLSGASRQDAEDVMQDVFMRAYSALRKDERELNLKAWLYRVAHNRCVDHVRRPVPPAADVLDMSRSPLIDPMETAQRRDDLRRLVADVGRLPDQQRSALLLREIDGLAYADIAEVLGVTVPAVKSLLVRARIGLAEAAEARETDCAVIRHDLAASYERGVKASARARRHMRECSGCADFKISLRSVRRQFAALSPAGLAGPLTLAAKALGLGGAGAGGGAAATAGGGAVVAGTATACKVAAVVCTAAIATGGAVEVGKRVRDGRADSAATASSSPSGGSASTRGLTSAAAAPAAVALEVIRHRTDRPAPAGEPRRRREAAGKEPTAPADAPAPAIPVPADPTASELAEATGGAAAPTVTAPPSAPTSTPVPVLPSSGETPTGSGGGGAPPAESSPSQSGGAGSASGSGSGGSPAAGGSAPPGQH